MFPGSGSPIPSGDERREALICGCVKKTHSSTVGIKTALKLNSFSSFQAKVKILWPEQEIHDACLSFADLFIYSKLEGN